SVPYFWLHFCSPACRWRLHTLRSAYRSISLRRLYRSMSNHPVLLQVTYGLPVTGDGTAITTITIGSPAPGSLHHRSVCFGHQVGGDGTTASMRLIAGTGGRESVSTEASITAGATPEMVTGAEDGLETRSSTTRLSRG